MGDDGSQNWRIFRIGGNSSNILDAVAEVEEKVLFQCAIFKKKTYSHDL
jgi:hypothetical protein